MSQVISVKGPRHELSDEQIDELQAHVDSGRLFDIWLVKGENVPLGLISPQKVVLHTYTRYGWTAFEVGPIGEDIMPEGPIKVRKKPVVVEAMLWNGTNEGTDDIVAGWVLDNDHDCAARRAEVGAPWDLYISTLEGEMKASPGDWVIRGVQGEFYPCKPDIFDATYERVTEEVPS